MTMKWTLTLATALLALGLSPARADAQQLIIWYMAPTEAMIEAFGAGHHLHGSLADGYREMRLTRANTPTFLKVAPENLVRTYNAIQPGTALRTRIDRVMQISGGVVDVNLVLVDDRTGLPGWMRLADWNPDDDGEDKVYVWPAAGVGERQANRRYQAIIGLGEQSSVEIQTWAGQWLAWEGTILHEMGHTQMVGEHSRWASISISYGGDGGHWLEELLGDQEVPFEEGLGTFWGILHNDPDGQQEVLDFLNNPRPRYALESWSVLAGTREIWNAPHEEVRDLPPPDPDAPPGAGYAVRSYRWRDVPGKYILFCETTSTAFHMFFWKYANNNRDQAFEMIFNSAQAMWQERRQRFLAYAVNRLALQLEDFARRAEGQAAATAGTLTSSMYPFALMDMLTHFGIERAEFEREVRATNPDRHPRAFTEYWNHRDNIRKLAQPFLEGETIRFEEAVRAVHQYLQGAGTILATAR
jgi:hypothetical protein